MGLAVRRSIIINAPRLHSTSCRVNRAAIWESARSGLVISLLWRLCPVWASRAEQADSICRGVIILPRFSAPILRMRCNTLIFSRFVWGAAARTVGTAAIAVGLLVERNPVAAPGILAFARFHVVRHHRGRHDGAHGIARRDQHRAGAESTAQSLQSAA